MEVMVYSSCDVQGENNGGDGLPFMLRSNRGRMEVMVWNEISSEIENDKDSK